MPVLLRSLLAPRSWVADCAGFIIKHIVDSLEPYANAIGGYFIRQLMPQQVGFVAAQFVPRSGKSKMVVLKSSPNDCPRLPLLPICSSAPNYSFSILDTITAQG